MATFQALMALSATQTRESQSAVQIALAQRQRKEELKRKQQEEQDKRQQEMERKLRMKHFEDQRQEEERKRRAEQAEKAKEAALRRREDEQRDALRYGPKKAKAVSSSRSDSPEPKWPTSSSQNREEVRRRRLPDEDDDDAPEFLTREEKRERKQRQEMRKLFNTTKRSFHAGGYSKSGRRLPGGAIDVTATSQASDANSGSKSVKERLAAMPNTLTKLNVVKRDTRTIDEILQDRAKAKEGKVLDGDDAREFTDWFGSSKKEKDAAKKLPNPSAANSGANSPSSQGSNSSTLHLSASTSKKSPIGKSSPLKTAPAKSAGSATSHKSTETSARSVSSNILTKTKFSKTMNNAGKSVKPSIPSDVTRSIGSTGKKRSRSSSRSESPPPAKRRATSTDYRDEIWQILGRNRSSYVSMDVFSDDEDMEADATILEKEEQQSARIAKREDVLALEAEKRHEEEKRRRKKEKEKEAQRSAR